ncbi:MAG: GNAT family N-acetyltransferase [Balneolaceae bacterium]
MNNIKITPLSSSDMNAVTAIWLKSSIRAHSFIPAGYWNSKVAEMKNIWLPKSDTWVLRSGKQIIGFYSLVENRLAALFLLPSEQRKGFGKQLLEHAKRQRSELTLTVYKENKSGYQFYLSQGFKVTGEQIDKHTGHIEYTMRSGKFLDS